MKKVIFTMAILSVLFTACGVGGSKTETTAADSTAVTVDTTSVATDSTAAPVDTLK